MRKLIINILHIVVLTTLGCIISAFAQRSVINSNPGSEITPEVGNKIQALIKDGNLPSVQAAAVSNDQIIWSQTFGSSIGTETMYMIGSIQKVFTATAILQLHEEGMIDIDKDINAYLPFSVRNPKYTEVPITIKILLSHSSGLEMFKNQTDWDLKFLTYKKDSSTVSPEVANLSREDFIKASLDPNGANYDSTVWHFEPGTNYPYSNSAYLILGDLIEKVSGQSYSEYIHQNIFEPLEMHNTMFYKDDTTANFATPYTREEMGKILSCRFGRENGI